SCHTAHCPLGNPPNPNDPFTLLCKCHETPIVGVGGETTMCNRICCDPCLHECDCPPGAAACKPKHARGLARRSAVREGSCGGTLCCGPNEYCASPARGKCCPENPRKDLCTGQD